jgi:hypothetical protein
VGLSRYLHPVLGAASLALLVYVASLGFRMRNARRGRAALAASHARWAPLAYALTLVSWAIGAGSTLWLRPDLEFATSLHFRSGAALVLLFSGSALTARYLRRGNASAREIHPWLGAGAVLLAAVHAAMGLRIMP